MCLITPLEAAADLRALADLIERLQKLPWNSGYECVNNADRETILKAVNQVTGIVSLDKIHDELIPARVTSYGELPAQHVVCYEAVEVDWDAWAHSTLVHPLDGEGVFA